MISYRIIWNKINEEEASPYSLLDMVIGIFLTIMPSYTLLIVNGYIYNHILYTLIVDE